MTAYNCHRDECFKYFNPHHPQGGDGVGTNHHFHVRYFNPHHPQGGDISCSPSESRYRWFQSTPPARWWPRNGFPPLRTAPISIHTTRKVVTKLPCRMGQSDRDFNPHHPQGGDAMNINDIDFNTDFNPHHPQGGDRAAMGLPPVAEQFQSTPPARWWLFFQFRAVPALWISIHTTRKVVTVWVPILHTGRGFQSTPPARWWLCHAQQIIDRYIFQSTPPARWWHREVPDGKIPGRISIHTTRKVVTSWAPRRYRWTRISIHTTRKVVTILGTCLSPKI